MHFSEKIFVANGNVILTINVYGETSANSDDATDDAIGVFGPVTVQYAAEPDITWTQATTSIEVEWLHGIVDAHVRTNRFLSQHYATEKAEADYDATDFYTVKLADAYRTIAVELCATRRVLLSVMNGVNQEGRPTWLNTDS